MIKYLLEEIIMILTSTNNKLWILSKTKILGIHTDINFQIVFWKNCYVTYNNKNGIDGISSSFIIKWGSSIKMWLY